MALNELIEEVSSNGYVLGLRCEKLACLLACQSKSFLIMNGVLYVTPSY